MEKQKYKKFYFKNVLSHVLSHFLPKLCSFSILFILSSVIEILLPVVILGFIIEKSKSLLLVVLLSCLYVFSKRQVERGDALFARSGSLALSYFNSAYIVPKITEMSYSDIQKAETKNKLTQIEEVVRGGILQLLVNTRGFYGI